MSTAALDVLPDAVVVVAPNGTIRYVNPAAAALVGAVVGRPFADLGLRDAAGREWWGCESAARTMAAVRGVPERRLLVGDRAVLLTASYLRTGGVLTEVVVALRGTRARDRVEREQADLLAAVAHELRAPLSGVTGFVATVRARWGVLDEVQQEELGWLEADAGRATRLLAALADVGRIDAGRLELRTQAVDVGSVARRVVARWVAAGEPADRFAVVRRGTGPEPWLDPDRVEQILANLVENAVRHGGGTVTITVVAETDGVAVTVDDQGPGVPADVAPRIFARSFRGTSRSGGSGLGLYLVRGLVAAHGGTVAVEPGPGGGARFRFRLPAGGPSQET